VPLLEIMISLDDKEWLKLQHAYGSAQNIPLLLSAVEADPSPKRDGEEGLGFHCGPPSIIKILCIRRRLQPFRTF
jgi:hypothetical protein